MPAERIVITYAAHTSACTFLLDAEGICRRIVMNPSNKRRDSAKSASRCVGAQYVASLDGAVAGCLVELPRVGASMLFARVDERGRVSLVRTGPVQRFETMRVEEDPFDDLSVKTSAPELPPSTGRRRSTKTPVVSPVVDDYFDGDRTIRLTGEEMKTEEYPSVPPPVPTVRQAQPRTTLPSPEYPVTLRDPRAPLMDESDPYVARPGRGPQARRSDPHVKVARRASSARWAAAAPVATRRRDR